MPPRTRTPSNRRPRVAGMRDPRRLPEAPEAEQDDAATAAPEAASDDTTVDRSAPAPAETDAGGSTATTGTEELGDERPVPSGTSPTAEEPTAEEPTAEAPTAESHTEAPTTEPSTTEAPTTEGPTTEGPAASTARPTNTGRGRPTGRRRPAPATGAATALDDRPRPGGDRPERDRPRRERRERGTTDRGAPATEETRREPGRLRRGASSVGGPFRRLGRSRVGLPVALGVAVVVLGLLAGLAAWRGHDAWTDGPVANSAVVDVSATAEVVGQTRQAVESIFSYDFAKLDDSVNAARSMGTGEFTPQYISVFDQTIRSQATQQQLRQTATVLNIGVRSIDGDRASVMALVQFHAERVTTRQSTDAPALLSLDMQRVDGRWKLAKLTPLTPQG